MLSLLFGICMIWFIGKFFIFGIKGILGNTEATLHSGIIPGNPDFNGSWRADVYCLPSDTNWRSYSTFGISFIRKKLR